MPVNVLNDHFSSATKTVPRDIFDKKCAMSLLLNSDAPSLSLSLSSNSKAEGRQEKQRTLSTPAVYSGRSLALQVQKHPLCPQTWEVAA